MTPQFCCGAVIKNAAGEQSEPAASVMRRQQQLLVMRCGADPSASACAPP